MRTGKLAVGLHMLAIQDTTEINANAMPAMSRAWGTEGNGVDAGLFIHPLSGRRGRPKAPMAA